MSESIEVFNRDQLIALIHADYKSHSVQVENYIEPIGINVAFLPFGKSTNPTWSSYMSFLSCRCFPPERPSAKILLKSLGLDTYDPDKIVRKTHGVLYGDFIWVRYENESVTFEDVRVR